MLGDFTNRHKRDEQSKQNRTKLPIFLRLNFWKCRTIWAELYPCIYFLAKGFCKKGAAPATLFLLSLIHLFGK